MTRDLIYRNRQNPIAPFAFNAAVADVFDDMIHRSVPMYAEIIRRQARIIEIAAPRGKRIYDLGSSTGNLALALCKRMPAGAFQLTAVDTSQPMLDISNKRLSAIGRSADVAHVNADVRSIAMESAGAVVANFTLQFIPPADRDALLENIHRALVPGGIFLFSEKIVHPDLQMADLQVDFYYRFKQENGYSELEISQKREALENVLVPETVTAHQERLRRCGFTVYDLWLKWFNFCSWICKR
ncbi:carboxy-S-adenosyl-L-methionine synthase CmoA [uncultured Desulfosarcina sp.]|uniref:carboxy-S-adenosyl-L-methionine synthase CmoA n=1 Tax=uncultured Desulfosarcina sp. TaxID=218289 RepID=UPI0029C9A45C|nr:carboxy-S-adenosyl-L-methionine synthase CmoA [uncultured Desulfosarcina sp.]